MYTALSIFLLIFLVVRAGLAEHEMTSDPVKQGYCRIKLIVITEFEYI